MKVIAFMCAPPCATAASSVRSRMYSPFELTQLMSSVSAAIKSKYLSPIKSENADWRAKGSSGGSATLTVACAETDAFTRAFTQTSSTEQTTSSTAAPAINACGPNGTSAFATCAPTTAPTELPMPSTANRRLPCSGLYTSEAKAQNCAIEV